MPSAFDIPVLVDLEDCSHRDLDVSHRCSPVVSAVSVDRNSLCCGSCQRYHRCDSLSDHLKVDTDVETSLSIVDYSDVVPKEDSVSIDWRIRVSARYSDANHSKQLEKNVLGETPEDVDTLPCRLESSSGGGAKEIGSD